MSVADALKAAQVIDLFTHLEIHLRGRIGKDLDDNTRAGISKKFDRPVCVIETNGRTRTWYTKGVQYCPWGPSQIVSDGGQHVEQYTDHTGALFNLDGPANLVHRYGEMASQDYYDQEGIHRRVSIHYDNTNRSTWADFRAHHAPEISNAGFLPDPYWVTREGIRTDWNIRSGLKIEHHLRASWIEIGSNDVTIEKAFSVKKYLEWFDLGVPHRTAGPARIVLNRVYEVFRNGIAESSAFEDWSAEWFVRGNPISTLEIKQFASRKGFTLAEGPGIMGAFTSPLHAEAFAREFAR